MYLSVLLILAIGTFFRRINVFPLRNWDESWYAEAVKNMASGNYGYLMQFWNGRYYFDHSPLYFWLSTPIFKLFGPGEWQGRLVSAISAVLCTLLIYLIGKNLKSERAGFISAIIFLTLGGVVMRFAHGNLDALLVCLFLFAFYFYTKTDRKVIFDVLCGISLGLGILVKSWGIGMFPVFWILLYSIFVRKKLEKRFFVIALAAIITFSWWYFLGTLKFGADFVKWFVLSPSEGRLGTPFKNFSLDYFIFAINDIGAWLFVPIVYLALKFKSALPKFIVPFTLTAFVYITFLNFLSDKSGWYLIPAYPLIAIIFGTLTDKLVGKKALFGLFLAILVVLGFLNVLRVENKYPDRSLVGAELGKKAKELIPYEDEIVLDDHDFTSFLFYSDQNYIYTLQDSKKHNEWWIILRSDLDGFVSQHQKVWIITRDKNKYSGFSEISSFGGYSFMRNY